MKDYFVYMLASRKDGALYIGVTSDLKKRVYEHKNQLVDGFSKRYKTHLLVYFETYLSPEEAIHREKCMKHWLREWKIKRIVENNPEWEDLYPIICQ